MGAGTQPGAYCRSQKRGRSGCQVHSVVHGAERESKPSCLSGQHILELIPVTRAEMEDRDVAAVVQQLPLPGRKQKHGA